MQKKRLAQVLMLAAATMVLGGCRQPKSVVGRWTSGSSTFYFREDGQMFYLAPSGTRYGGAYFIDTSTSPMVVKSRLSEMGGGFGSRDLTWQIEFVTKDRIRVVMGEAGTGSRPQLLSRVTQEQMDEKKDAQ